MKGKIIKGSKMPKYLQKYVLDTLKFFDSDGNYFVAQTFIGILIFEVEE